MWVPEDIYGWFNHPEAMQALLDRMQPRWVVEVGSWEGQSAIALARHIAAWGGRLTCVDDWQGNTSFPPELLARTSSRTNVGAAEQAFLDNVQRYAVTNLDVIREPSPAACAGIPDGAVDLVYLDGNHEGAAVAADLEAWWPKLKPGGIVAGDDYGNPTFPGLSAAWDASRPGVLHRERPWPARGLVWRVKAWQTSQRGK